MNKLFEQDSIDLFRETLSLQTNVLQKLAFSTQKPFQDHLHALNSMASMASTASMEITNTLQIFQTARSAIQSISSNALKDLFAIPAFSENLTTVSKSINTIVKQATALSRNNNILISNEISRLLSRHAEQLAGSVATISEWYTLNRDIATNIDAHNENCDSHDEPDNISNANQTLHTKLNYILLVIQIIQGFIPIILGFIPDQPAIESNEIQCEQVELLKQHIDLTQRELESKNLQYQDMNEEISNIKETLRSIENLLAEYSSENQ